MILLNQAGRTSHQAICDSLELFAREVMPEFHARQPAQDAWKADVLAGRIVLEELETDAYDLYAHQNEDIVRLTPEQLKQRMAEKEKGGAGRADRGGGTECPALARWLRRRCSLLAGSDSASGGPARARGWSSPATAASTCARSSRRAWPARRSSADGTALTSTTRGKPDGDYPVQVCVAHAAAATRGDHGGWTAGSRPAE